MPDGFEPRVAVQPFGAAVPSSDRQIRIDRKDRIHRRVYGRGEQRIRLLAALAVRDVDNQPDRARGALAVRPIVKEGLTAQENPAGRAVEARDAMLILIVATAFGYERRLQFLAEARAHVVRDNALEQIRIGV